MMNIDVSAVHLAIAGLVGLAVGIEREWSGHARGPSARFAGIRTFLVLGLLGGSAGLFIAADAPAVGATVLGGGALFVVASYVVAVKREGADLDGTTEGAALLVLALGALACIGQPAVAAGAAAVLVFALGEKERLHWLVSRIGESEMRAALQFAVLALVILPILPPGPYLGELAFRPRALWGIVVLLSALNFAGYIARRSIGAGRGYGITGLIGGLVSSTAVTLQFSGVSRDEMEKANGMALASGLIGACSILPLRVTLVSSLLHASTGRAVGFALLGSALVGFAMFGFAIRALRLDGPRPDAMPDSSPLRLRSALQMAALFQVAIAVLAIAKRSWGATGMLASAVVLGITDADALTVSMTRAVDGPELVAVAARAITAGVVANTAFKLAIVLTIGRGRFRLASAIGLIAIGVSTGAGWFLIPFA